MIKFIIAQGIGFSPGSTKYMPTLGFASASAAPGDSETHLIRNLLVDHGRLI